MSFECKSCGREIMKNMQKSRAHKEMNFFAETLPDMGPSHKQVNLPLDRLKDFNAHYLELAEFAAWVCGTTKEKLNRLDMMKYLMRKQAEDKDKP